MTKRKRYPKLPNGFGSIKKLSGKNRANPYGVYPPVTDWTDEGVPIATRALCYVDDWYKGFAVLTWYNHGEYYPGKEKELLDFSGRDLHAKVMDAALERIGIEKHTPHDCRHTFNVLCDKYKVDERDKKLMLGHTFQDVTNKVYGHRSLEDLRNELEKIKIHTNE
ncbi:MAG: site-specific integrase [Lachnospiraceae bacterium]|nr:site-specific integrase [Lachnospiraceae bacterium]